MTKACDPGRLCRTILQTSPLRFSLFLQLIDLTDTETLQQRAGDEEVGVKKNLQEKKLKTLKYGNGNTNNTLVFKHIKPAPPCSLNYFHHFAQVWGTSAPQTPLVGCSQDPRKRAASPTIWGDCHSLVLRSDYTWGKQSFLIFKFGKKTQIPSDYAETTIVKRNQLSGLHFIWPKKPLGFQ